MKTSEESPVNNNANTSAKKINKETKLVLIAVIFAIILIAGLIIGNIIVRTNNGGKSENGISKEDEDEDDNTEEEYEDIETAPINKKTYSKKLELERSKLKDPDDIDELFNLYQKYIDIFQNEIKDEDIVAGLYNERLSVILGLDVYSEYGDQVIADAIAIDNILQTVSSAINVYNCASMYNRTDLMEQYEGIAQERLDQDNNDTSDSDDSEDIVDIDEESYSQLFYELEVLNSETSDTTNQE